jgi:hypothetical protein
LFLSSSGVIFFGTRTVSGLFSGQKKGVPENGVKTPFPARLNQKEKA